MKDHFFQVVQLHLWTLLVLFIASCLAQGVVYTDQNRHYNAYAHQNTPTSDVTNENGVDSSPAIVDSLAPNLIVPYDPAITPTSEEKVDEGEEEDVGDPNLEDDTASLQIAESSESPSATTSSLMGEATPRTLIPRRVYSHYKQDRPFNRFLNYGRRREKPGPELENEILRSKVDTLGSILKLHVQSLRQTPSQAVELVFLVDSSSSVGADNFFNELKFVKKLLADFTVSYNQTRVAVITFSSQDRVNVAINHVSSPTHHNHKCVLLEWQMPKIRFMGGGTYTMGAMLEAQRVLSGARPHSAKAVFLVTDGYSNGGDPRPAAEALKRRGVRIFTFGIRNGNVEELYDMASHPREEHSYILDSFEEFEALARRALHEDLQNGVLMDQNPQACSSLCNASYHTCCDRHASCTCGTHTGHYLCTCQPGYYGTGLQGNCHPCPTGTYRESQSPGDVSSCQPCPDPHMTSPQGSTSPHQCYCTRGYDQIAMRCHKRQCPPLSPPANGYFIPASCSNVVNAACGVRCSPAYRLEGSSIRLCREDGTWSGGDTRCVMKTCRPLLSPSHGQMKCTSSDGRIDTECYFGCDPGYNLVGSVRRTCLPVAMWDGIPAHCKPVFCPPLPPLRHGTISPHSCLAGKSRYGALCNFTCSVGFLREGLDTAHCGGHGQWEEGTGQVRCIDIQPPLLKCPAHIATTALPNENYANVPWEEPFAKDNSKGEVILTTIPATTMPMKLLIGQHTITYQAKDTWGNMDSCQFLVQVADSEPPRVDWCESPPTFLAGEDEVDVYWEEPLFSDNSRNPVKVIRSLDPGRFPQGSTLVQYLAEDESGNTATCNITITVQKHACQLPLDPINGSANCTEDPEAVFCSFACEEGYAFAMRPEQDYFCAYDGVWRPDNSPLNFPDCSVTTVSNTISQTGEMAIDSDGSVCDDIFFMGQVENQLESRLEVALNAMCSDDVVCEVAAVEAVCEGLLAEAEEEVTNMAHRRKRSLADGNIREQFWAGDDHSKWRYWQREGRDLGVVNHRAKRSLNGGNFILETPDSLISRERHRRQLGLLQPMFMTSGRFGGGEAVQENRPRSDKGEYLGVLIDIIVRSLGTDISFNRFATFLTGLKQENGQFGSHDFMAAFSTEFGEGKAQQLKELATRKFGHQNIFSSDNLPSGNTSSNTITSSSFSASTETSLSSLSLEDVEVIKEMVAGTSLSLQNAPARLEMAPTSDPAASPGEAASDLPQRDQADQGMTQHTLRIQGLQKVVQSVSRSNFKVRFQVQGHGEGARDSVGQAMGELLSAAGRGEFDILFGDRLLRVAAIRLAEDPEYLCEAGSVPQDDQCVMCPIGTFFNVVLRECQSCPQGSYQPQEGQVTCLVCPENTSTKKELARSTQDCKAYCLPGSYSSDGLEPCTTCALGEYQDEYSSYACAVCPHATTTWRRGSWLLDDCKPMCPPGQVSETGLFPCFPCPRDHFQHLQGASHCYRCPNTSTSDTAGASSINSCQGMEETFKGAYTSLEVLSINDCFSLPCSNGGTCAPLEFGYICVCQPGYSGVQCEVEINECGSEPCLHGAQCQDLLGAYECLCAEGYQGDQCQENIDDCAGTPCRNLATCMDGVAAYTCLCQPGYSGELCETDIDNCEGEPCAAGSTCEDLLNDFRCACPPGFQGRLCEVRVDHCESSPCEHGTCAALVDDYSCTCEPGYSGRNCDTNIDECVSNPCLNGGLCTDWINSYTCTCQPGYTGGQCGQELTTDFVLHFPTSSIMNYAMLETLPEALSEISVCFWMRSSDRDNYGTPFSYATQHHDNAFTLTDYNGFVLCVNGEKRITDVRGNDGLWHLVCVTWSGDLGGAWRLFVDGALKDSGVDLAPGAIITADGAWVLGQEQDERGGRYNPQESFVGDLSHLNIWNTFMTQERAEALFWLCDRYVGNVRGWPDFQAGIRGQVTLQSSTFCHGCFPPAVPLSGRLEPVSLGRGGGEADTRAVVRVVCDTGHKLRKGDAERQCLVTGLWSGEDPLCERLSCGYPGYLRNGKIDGTRYRFGDTIVSSCEFGYRLEGSASRTCQEDGSWSGEQPSCSLISCSRPPPGPNMEVVAAPNALLPNTRVSYSCDRGYQMDGPSTQTCGRDGEWDSSQPSCQASSCAVLPSIENGVVSGSAPIAPGGTVTVTCESGFNIQGGAEVPCDSSGQWPSRLPRCIRNKCPKPPVVENGSVRVRASTTGREASYRCEVGYLLEGKQTLNCREDGTWDGPFSKCVTKPCPTPPVPEHGKLVATKKVWRVGDTATFGCDVGFKLVGNGDINCVDDYEETGKWDHTSPTCSVVVCAALADIPNGMHTFTNRPAQATSFSGRGIEFPQGELEISWRKKRSPDEFPSIGHSSDYDYGQMSASISSGDDYFGQSTSGQSVSDYDYGQASEGFVEFSQSSSGFDLGQSQSSHYEDFGQSVSTKAPPTPSVYGTEVEYTCRPGYKLIGSKKRRCDVDGEWDTPLPHCYEKYCTELPSLENGHPTYQGSGVSSRVQFECNEGYQLVGDFEMVCQPDRSWLGSLPSCSVTNCGAPPNLANGTVGFTETTFGAVAIYDCYVGYVLEGSFERFCTNEGFWNGSMPRCLGITCRVPPVIDNGYITFEGSLYVGSPIEYECKECYQLNGTRFRYCQVDGTWDLVEPTCDMIYCDALPDEIPNGRIIGNDNSCGSLVEFECNPGYEMKGRQRTTCSEYKRWSSPIPTCERISCGTPDVLDYGRVIGESFTFTDKVTYECGDGYVLRGSNIRVCQVDGTWSDSSPYCDIKNCTKPKGPSNGRVRLSGLFYGSTANIICDPGFRLDGPRNLRCTENAVWDQVMPYCLPIICPPAILVKNGSYNSTERQFESFTVLNYTCNTGFFTTAKETKMLCSAAGAWEGTPITCQIKNCGDPGTLPNGRIIGREYTYGKVVRFECEEGYNLLGEATATCTADGAWSNYATSCTQITCEDPTFIENAKLVLDNSAVVFGTSLYYECEKGYLMSGAANLTCQMNGRWTQTAPECGIVTCPIPAEDFNAARVGDVFEYDHTINYTCNEGFIMDGSPSLKCLETGEWSHDFPVCEMISCSPPDDIENGSYESRKMNEIPIKTEPSLQLASQQSQRRTKTTKSGRLVSLLQQGSMREGVLYHFGDVIEYACNEGHSINSDGIISCTANGWSLPPPTCHAITCPIPITIRNGNVIGDDVAYGAVLEYRCDEGYEIVGVSQRTCQANKEWSDTEPFCRIIECQRPAALDNGRTIGTSIKYKSVLSYICDSGFKLEGVSTRVCQSDGLWTGEQPECIEVFCSVPDNVPNAIQDVSRTKVGDTARYSCMEGYRREGAAVLNCQESGLWDHVPPACIQIDCGAPPTGLNLILTGTATVYASQVTYSCERGYRLEGAEWNTCTQAGLWSSPAPVCWQISCPDPKQPANGYIIPPPERLVLTTTAIPTTTIKTTRTTTATTTTPHPTTTPARKKGSRKSSRRKRATSWAMSEIIPYDQLQQSQQQREAVKQPPDEQVETPGEGSFGSFEYTTEQTPVQSPSKSNRKTSGNLARRVYVVDDIVRYGCNEGFFTDSTAPEAVCTEASVWSASPIQCRRVACGSPPLPEHASARGLHGDSFLYGSQYLYTCLQGYTMKNSATNSTTLTCGADGQWAGTVPQCQPVHCGNFQKLDDATYSVETPDTRYPLSLGTIITFTCENGHRMNGRGVLQCDANGLWDGVGESHCEEELCKDIPRVLNTTSTFDRDARPQMVTYACRDGFKMQGSNSTLICSFGQWSSVNFSCLPVNCYEPAVPANGKITARHFSLGSVATYSCTDGHTLRGEGSVVCGADGLWHGNVPYCEPVHCGMPQSPESGSVSVSGTVYQSEATYSCVRGYLLRGNSSRTCDERGDWSGHMPSCYRKDCGELAPPRHGFVMGVSTLYGDRVRFACEVGHVLTGASVATCQHTGNWSDASPTCKAVQCPAPSVPPNTEFASPSVKASLEHIYNTTLGFRCLEGHIPRGDLSIRCTEDGTWSPFMGQCSKLSCGRPIVNSEGAIILGRSFYYKDRVTVKCPEGTSTLGPLVLSCQSDGTWSSSASCTASCSRQCFNGGVCLSSSRCSCKPGFFGDRCQHARCSLSCLNGGWCSGPHKCQCQPGYEGRRCHRPTCSSGCVGGRCIGPNVCLCPHDLTGPSCQRSPGEDYPDYQDVLPQTNYDDWDVAALRRKLDDDSTEGGDQMDGSP